MRIARELPQSSNRLEPEALAAPSIDPRACVDERCGAVRLARGASIGPYAVVRGPVVLGLGARIDAHAIVGESPGKRGAIAMGTVTLGARARIGAGAIVEAGTTRHGVTIESDAWVMPRAYLGHDARIGARATIAAGATLGGFCCVDDDAFVGLSAALHPRSTIGAWARVGMRATVTRDVPPGAIVTGTPARFRRIDALRLERAKLSRDEIDALDRWVRRRLEGAVDDPEPLPIRIRAVVARFLEHSSRPMVTRLR